MSDRAKKALAIISTRREKALSEAKKRTRELYSAIPLLSDIDNEISASSYLLYSSAQSAEKFGAVKSQIESLYENRNLLLIEHGFIANYDFPVFVCDRCRDTGYVKLEKCTCLAKLESEVIEEADLGSGLKDCTFDSFSLDYYSTEKTLSGKSAFDIMSTILSRCKDYADSFGEGSKSLIFSGGTGLGKTHLSAAIGHSVAAKGYDVVYDSAQKITSECRRALFSSAFDCADKYYSCSLLIIDDLGAEVKSEYTVSALTELINRRLVYGLPVIISTNLELAKIKEAYGARLFSRIVGNFTPYIFAGKDIRYMKLGI